MLFLLRIFTEIPCILTNVRKCLVYMQKNSKFFDCFNFICYYILIKKGGGSYEKESFEKNDRLFY